MGCQASKGATAPAKPSAAQSSAKTLLDSAEVAKAGIEVVSVDAVDPVSPVPPTPSRVDMSSTEVHETLPASTAEVSTNSPVATAVQDSPTDGTHSLAFLRKDRTSCLDGNQVDIMVVEFRSHDSTVGSAIGRNHRETQWKVMYDHTKAPIDIKLQAQEHKLHSHEVSVECNGLHILHGAGNHTKAKMAEDFHYQWPFRATIRGVNEVGFFEFSPPHFCNSRWFPATITSQRQDGLFEVRAQEPDANGRMAEMTYQAVHKDNLREAASGNPLSVSENCLKLEVPKHDPLHASLRLANGEPVTHHFGRASPHLATGQKKPELALKVSKDRSMVTGNVGHRVLSHFVSGEVQAVNCDMERLKHSWTLQVGPFAEHTIQIEKKHTLGKIVTLSVDDEVLVESNAVDIGCTGKEWQCTFRFVGERILDFEVYKTNKEGSALDDTAHVKERRTYVHECCVTVSNEWDFSSAHLLVDGKAFTELPTKPQVHDEPNLTMAPLAMLHSYGVATPYKVDQNALSNISIFAKQVVDKTRDGRMAAGGFFAQCCGTS